MATQGKDILQDTGLEQGGERQTPVREGRAQRSESRAAQTYAFFLKDLEAKGLDRKLAEQAIQAVLCVMERRLMSDESRHMEAQLPRKVVALVKRCAEHQDLPYEKFGREEFLGRVTAHLNVAVDEAERISCAVLSTVREHLTPGEAEDVLGQLPLELRTLWFQPGTSMRQRISDVMKKGLECVGPHETLKAVAEKMRACNIGPLPVCEGDQVLGIITDRDIVIRAVSQGWDPNTTPVSAAMTHQVESVFVDESLGEAARRMNAKQIRRILVMDRQGKLAGILSTKDIAEALGEHIAGRPLGVIARDWKPLH
ncbi:DUF2267 domain-containing protein [Stigmatella aurantiaca]|uniref:CBS domain pair protein n=1 Tax=Stigmatella aurantiaca (strain DW4/3-1) TaxID=378806 RepID=Q09D84_STIAD|nr:DUF2267 domain-containing protein [Stigmatella aurantiaca]ADO67822.1 CBS domain protein [Stigmatella aurantiaca DW4/3-1]EAU69616.1 CBS domain pair protein [Stigmatella aurantiaca DW4/3-1]